MEKDRLFKTLALADLDIRVDCKININLKLCSLKSISGICKNSIIEIEVSKKKIS